MIGEVGSAQPQDPVGAVLVCGGGVAGIQASLDLSAAGFKVYLVEESPTIGGSMARLDKTFPTGDCATCIISPKLVECMRESNIEVLTMADVEALEGEAGRFTARVRIRPRSVDPGKCTGCGDCWEHCPVLNVLEPPAPFRPEAGLADEDEAVLTAILGRHDKAAGALLAVLQEASDAFGHLVRPVVERIAAGLDLSPAQALRVASFYDEFQLEPRARHRVEVCNGTSCYAGGAGALRARIEEEIGALGGEGRFELRTVRCLGLCALTPAMRIDGTGFGRVEPGRVRVILERYE